MSLNVNIVKESQTSLAVPVSVHAVGNNMMPPRLSPIHQAQHDNMEQTLAELYVVDNLLATSLLDVLHYVGVLDEATDAIHEAEGAIVEGEEPTLDPDHVWFLNRTNDASEIYHIFLPGVDEDVGAVFFQLPHMGRILLRNPNLHFNETKAGEALDAYMSETIAEDGGADYDVTVAVRIDQDLNEYELDPNSLTRTYMEQLATALRSYYASLNAPQDLASSVQDAYDGVIEAYVNYMYHIFRILLLAGCPMSIAVRKTTQCLGPLWDVYVHNVKEDEDDEYEDEDSDEEGDDE